MDEIHGQVDDPYILIDKTDLPDPILVQHPDPVEEASLFDVIDAVSTLDAYGVTARVL